MSVTCLSWKLEWSFHAKHGAKRHLPLVDPDTRRRANNLIKDNARLEAGRFELAELDFKFERSSDGAVDRPPLPENDRRSVETLSYTLTFATQDVMNVMPKALRS